MRLACAPGTQARGSRYIRRTKLPFIGHNKTEPHVHIEPNSWLLSIQLRHGPLEQLTIQVEPHRHHVPPLSCPTKAARASERETAHGAAQAAPRRPVLVHCRYPL